MSSGTVHGPSTLKTTVITPLLPCAPPYHLMAPLQTVRCSRAGSCHPIGQHWVCRWVALIFVCIPYRAVVVQCIVRCTVIRYGTVRTFFTVFLKIGTVYMVRYGTVYSTIRFFCGLAVQSPWLCNLLLLMSLRTCKPWGFSSCPRFCQRAPSGNACSTTSPCPADPVAGWAHFLPSSARPALPHHLSPPAPAAHCCQQPPQQTAGSGAGRVLREGCWLGGQARGAGRVLPPRLCSGAGEVHRCEDVKLINVIVSLAVLMAHACIHAAWWDRTLRFSTVLLLIPYYTVKATIRRTPYRIYENTA